MLYLDNSATSLKKPMCVYKTLFYNTLFNSANAGRGSHKPSLKATKGIIDAQESIAKLINAKNPQNIAFCQNATLALNMIILGVLHKGEHIVVTQMDHNSVLRPAFLHGLYTVVKADKTGWVDPELVREAIRPDTRLVVCTHASNVCGTIEPIAEIGKIAKEKGVLFLVDTAQTLGCVDVDAEEMNADFIAFSGHKGLMGPLGTGGVYVKDEKLIRPIITGGTGSQSEMMIQPQIMPDMLHAGTVNTPAIAALGEATRFIMREGVKSIGDTERELANEFAFNLMSMGNIKVYGRKLRTGAVAFNIDGMDSVTVGDMINKHAVVRAGYHCAPLAHRALGTYKTGAVRVSFGYFNKKKDVDKITDIVWNIAKNHEG